MRRWLGISAPDYREIQASGLGPGAKKAWLPVERKPGRVYPGTPEGVPYESYVFVPFVLFVPFVS